jgi:two-component system, NtrC family, response regulator AtoC
MPRKILIIDDDTAMLELLDRSLSRKGYRVLTGRTGKEGLKISRDNQVDLVLLDVNLPDIEGVQVLKKLKKSNPKAAVIMITAHGEVETAVESMRLGAFDYVTKPFGIEEIELLLSNAVRMLKMENEISVLKRTRPKVPYDNIVSASGSMKKVIDIIEKVGRSPDTTVLITGESGTGKELVANAIHYLGPRAKSPFVAVCCTVLQEHLLESELFGHEKGAFTDARTQKRGLFEVADGGTIFLDEIGDMDAKLQGKLLRFLEQRTFRRLGGNQDIEVDIRVLAATNKKLAHEVEEGNFRGDLYFRLNVIPIEIPPLRERKEDISSLINTFIEDYNRKFNRKVKGVNLVAERALVEYRWPGNIRELKNIIERIFILEDPGEIGLEHLPPEIITGGGMRNISISPGEDNLTGDFTEDRRKIIEQFEKSYIESILKSNGGNVSRSAESAGMTRSNFQRLMKKYDIRRKEVI